jgi:hypothetical protein
MAAGIGLKFREKFWENIAIYSKLKEAMDNAARNTYLYMLICSNTSPYITGTKYISDRGLTKY